VDLTIPKYSHKSVVPEVAQNLSLLSNLHSIQLVFLFQYPHPPKILSEFRYPNVHTLNLCRLSPYGHILQACPNTKHFSFYNEKAGLSGVRELLNKECSGNIEKVGRLMNLQCHLGGTSMHFILSVFYIHRPHAPDIVSGLPHLRDISLDSLDL
jgi:hypothetical protein